MVSFPFDAINDAALARLPSLLQQWFPNGKRAGHEWCVGSIDGEAGESFKVNMQTGKWAEFNGRGETGGDVIGLYAAKFFRGNHVQAALDLADKFGIKIKRPPPKPKSKEWIPLIPPPADAGPPNAMLLGYDMLHRYTSLNGSETHFVGRIEARGDKRKQFVPITYGELNGTRGWHKKAPNPPRPLYGLNKLTATPDAAVLLCEGENAADAAQWLFPNHACMSWFGGVAQIEHADLGPLASRKIIVWPDADEPGLNAACKLIPRLPDNAQVVRTDGLAEAFDAANLKEQGCDDPAAWLNQRLIPARDLTGVVLPDRFSITKDGLWYQPPPRANNSTEPEPMWICARLHVVAETCDDTWNNHGLLLRWPDRTGHEHTWSMPLRMVHGDGSAIAAELEDAGLSCGASNAQHERLKEFLGRVKAPRRVRCVAQAGWHGNLFVMPDGRVFGADPNSVVLQTEHVVKTGRYARRGTLKEWQDNIAQHAVGNHLLALIISGAFVAPLQDILGEPSRGGNLFGPSQTGKTTLVRCAISVHGPAEEAYIRTWRATANGLEAAAAETNHLLMTLDELGQANPYEAGSVVYMLGNSAGKQRANRVGGARQPHNWLTFFWSTGETTLAAKLTEAGQRARAGMAVRMVEVSADAGCGMGVWQDLFDFTSGAALTNHLREASRTYCGTAGPAFLDRLARDRADKPAELTETLRKMLQKFLDVFLPEGADGQVQSVAAFFALIGAAGELAAAYKVLPWDKGQALTAAGWSFQRWLTARGGAGASEDMQALEQVRAYVATYENSRFEPVVEDSQNDDDAQRKQRVIIERAGFKLTDEFLILPDAWKKVCSGLHPTMAAKALKEKGLLIPDDDGLHLAAVRRCGTHGPIRGYVISARILGDDEIAGDEQ